MDRIKLFVMDVDGTLTDGKIYMGQAGEFVKAFNIKDGYAIQTMLKEQEIIPVIMTGRSSEIVKLRAKELDINFFYQGVKNKQTQLNEIIKLLSINNDINWNNVAYIGDDLNDIPVMKKIKHSGGVIGCPSDAAKEVKLMADYVCLNGGGDGAVREFIEWIISIMKKAKNRYDLT